jgi:hypothetical protein
MHPFLSLYLVPGHRRRHAPAPAAPPAPPAGERKWHPGRQLLPKLFQVGSRITLLPRAAPFHFGREPLTKKERQNAPTECVVPERLLRTSCRIACGSCFTPRRPRLSLLLSSSVYIGALHGAHPVRRPHNLGLHAAHLKLPTTLRDHEGAHKDTVRRGARASRCAQAAANDECGAQQQVCTQERSEGGHVELRELPIGQGGNCYGDSILKC